MNYPRLGVLDCIFLVAVGLLAAAPPISASEKALIKPSPSVEEASALAMRIDQLLASKWQEAQVEPSDPADDAEFMRRIYLDVAGRIPTVSEARAFLTDNAQNKRPKLIEKLLASPAYANHFTNVWGELLIPEARAANRLRFLEPGFDAWLRKQFANNTRYDQTVRELIAAELFDKSKPGASPYSRTGRASPISFYLAKELKPENLAAATTRIFMGVKLECAQCHDHPHAKWTRQQFWETAAFFACFEGQNADGFVNNAKEVPERHEVVMPGGGRVVQAAFLDGGKPDWKNKISPRVALAEWLTRPENPYFARATVNRLWGHFFGNAIVEPIDDLIPENKPSHPELLEELARQFAAHNFDFKYLIRAITMSRAYQLSSRSKSADPPDVRLFARMAIKGLSPEQFFDSLIQATGYREDKSDPNRVFDPTSARQEFLTKFAQTDKRTEAQTSILQALALMNGRFVHSATTPEVGETLAAVLDAPFFDTAGRIETLFLATLSRKARSEEAEKLIKFVNKAKTKEESRTALADVFWALLNSSEFNLNH
jgi:hypothetical protein